MTNSREQILEERRRLRAEYGELYQDLVELLFRLDPAGINFEMNSDEYEPEVGTILPRLHSCRSEDDVRDVVREEFLRWFGAGRGGTKECHQQIATGTWELWTKRGKDKAS